MKLEIRRAFEAVRNGYSPDRIVADPDLNAAFLAEYRFASEIAARLLERRDQITLDAILCDPVRAAEFDAIAASLAPGFTPLQYRWAALTLRKMRRLVPELISHALPPKAVTMQRVKELDLQQVPRAQGLYVFLERTQALYVGEAENLRTRIEKHLDHSDNKHLARWLWDRGSDEVFLELHELDPSTVTRVRRSLEVELIRSRRPVFNIQGVILPEA